MLHRHSDRVLCVKREPPRQHFEECNAQCVEVSSGSGLLATRLLGGKVVDGTKNGTSLRHSSTVRSPRDAKIRDLDLTAARQQDVLRLDITVNKAAHMCSA
ncbi:MAG: hypothetical protein JWO59_1056 [Chloroflexi bacterium]|nr:hypothetical protein [Chloroflexota bacterium]